MRKTYLDNIRWITVVLVVIYHIIYMYNGVQTIGVLGPLSVFQPQDVFQYVVYPWFMLLLFVVSGMSARFSLEKQDHREFLKNKTRKLLVPSTIGLLVFGWIQGYYNVSIGGGFASMGQVPKPVMFLILVASGTGVLWYIQLLWFFCLLLVLLRKLGIDRLYPKTAGANTLTLLVLTPVIYIAAQILNTPVVVVYRFGIYGAGFLIGYLILSHDEVMDRLERRWVSLTASTLILCVTFVALYRGQPYADHSVLDTPLCNVYAWIAVLGVLAFMKHWGDFDNSFTEFMKRQSWGLYVFHYLPLSACAWYLRSRMGVWPAAVLYLSIGVSAFAGAFLLNVVISRIPVLRWCILGIKGGNK